MTHRTISQRWLFLGLAFLLHLSVLHPAAARALGSELTAHGVEIPIDHASHHVIVNARINGRGPYPFMLDTGTTGHGSIDHQLVAELGLPVVDRVRVDDGSGRNTSTARRVSVETLTLAGATFSNVKLVGGDYKNFARQAGTVHAETPVGILGIGLFEDLLLTIDYTEHRVLLSRGALSPKMDDVISYRSPDGLVYLPARVGNESIEALLDTGAQGGCILPLETLGRLSTLFDPVVSGRVQTANNRTAMLSTILCDSLRIGNHEIENPSASFTGLHDFAMLGHGVLAAFRITVDQKRRLIQLVRPVPRDAHNRLGLRARPNRGRPEIIHVEPGSAADRSGLRVGDVIVKVDGTNVLELLEDSGFDDVILSDRDLPLLVRRAGRYLALELPPSE